MYVPFLVKKFLLSLSLALPVSLREAKCRGKLFVRNRNQGQRCVVSHNDNMGLLCKNFAKLGGIRMENAAAAGPNPLDVGRIIDDRPLSGFQISIIVFCALVAVLDGADSFSIGVAAPSIAAKLGLPLSGFGAVFSAALFGATLGAFSFGPLADQFGRKPMLVIAVAIFAFFTFATALVGSRDSLLVVRFFAGLGLGGATPCFLTLASEYAPARIRASVTSLMWAGFPLGGMIGGFLNSYLIGAFDWQAMFYVGGVAPLVVGVLIALFVPESVRYLIARGGSHQALLRVVGRLAPEMAASLHPNTKFVVREKALAGSPVRNLFTDGRALATPLLWVPFFMAFGVLIIVVLWTPALLRQAGMSAPNAALVVAFHGLGGFIGMAVAGRLLERFGTLVLVPAFVIGAVFTLLLGMVGTSLPLAALCDALIGVFVGIGASGMIALASLVYPTSMRSSGIGWAMAMGRLGQVFAPLIAGAMQQAGWNVGRMFVFIAVAPLIAAVFVPLVNLAFRGSGAAEPAGAVPVPVVEAAG
jgi:AAHS family 4-hydroxybenzoate transporter-like MFS transporter